MKFVLERVCGFDHRTGTWTRGTNVSREWGRRAVTGESVRPWHLWRGPGGALLPVFREPGPRVGIGKGRRTISQTLGWLRAGNNHLALVTNGRQWRLLFAGLDFEAWCEWDRELWFEEGRLADQVEALRTLLQPKLWTPGPEDSAPPLLQAIRDTRKGQADLSETLGERVREAVEMLIQGHGEVLKEQCADVDPADIYRAACRVAMRLVVILFAESRDLLPRDNALYHDSYGLNGLLARLQASGGGGSLSRGQSAWPQVLALFNLVRDGSHFPKLPVTKYGGDLFEPGRRDTDDGVSRALAVFETGCRERDVLSDNDLLGMLEQMTCTRTRIRQGRGGTWVTVPVDFSDLSSDYIGTLYEGLLDYELKTAPPGEPVIFLAAGNHPALPMSRLEEMDDKAIKTLFGNLKKDAADNHGPAEPDEDPEDQPDDNPNADEAQSVAGDDPRRASRTRAEKWARRAARLAGLVKKPRGNLTPEHRLKAEAELGRTARKLVAHVCLPGEWYLVRWGGTRKGSGSYYTRPGLVVPTVQRTLRPLAYDPPLGKDGEPDREARAAKWTPKRPEQILELKVCDPACGSGAFVLSALRFLTNALFASLQHHERIKPDGARTLVRLLGPDSGEDSHGDRLADELIPVPPDHNDFELRLRAVLRRHVVERCIYAVDLDPLAVELCRLSLWIETMDRNLPFGFLDHKVKCGNSLIGAWFNQFAHYPVMAWKNREGGDKNHNNGVHFEKNARTKAIKAFVKDTLTPDLQLFLRDPDLFLGDYLRRHEEAHAQALTVLERMHNLPVQDAAARARMYRDEFVGSRAWRSIKDAMDLWCACWFWPADEIECAPLPRAFVNPALETRSVARRVARKIRFFHWELEFPDVFREDSSGFDAMLGNPPWDIAKPNSREFFANVDPLYRSYEKQAAKRKQAVYFADAHYGSAVERDWIEYNARFRFLSNYVKYAARPFGNPAATESSAGCFIIRRGKGNPVLHDSWGRIRKRSAGFADARHPFRCQGSADLNLYKMFLETTHALSAPSGRFGLVVPSGLYSDYGTRALRILFLDHCRWEWLFGIENRDRVFPIATGQKFGLVIVEKGGSTQFIRTMFMQTKVAGWECAEDSFMPYTRDQIKQFSPNSQTLLEIQSKRDLEILEKIYTNSVILGDPGPDGWDIRYTSEFHMTNDSELFPPRWEWEGKGYRPDEYSRWLLGEWRPIGELWAELGVNPLRPVAAEVELEDWLFDTTAGPVRRRAEARFAHGHLLRPGDVARTEWTLRCAQPPYDRLPVPRVAIPPGVILSRSGTEWIRDDDVRDIALPMYIGRMIYVHTWAATSATTSPSRRLDLDAEFLLGIDKLRHRNAVGSRVVFRDISNSTNERSFVTTLVPRWFPCGNKTPLLMLPSNSNRELELCLFLGSLVFDWSVRQRMVGQTLNWHIVKSLPLPPFRSSSELHYLRETYAKLAFTGSQFADDWLRRVPFPGTPGQQGEKESEIGRPAVPRLYYRAPAERCRLLAKVDAVAASAIGLSYSEFCHVLADCDYPNGVAVDRTARGFWRIDKRKPPEMRRTVLTLIAFRDLQDRIRDNDGDRQKGIKAFIEQNSGEGWQIPERLCLAEHGLGHDERAKHRLPVASRLGPRFYDWQLVQSREEAWDECRLHTCNLRGVTERVGDTTPLDVANCRPGSDDTLISSDRPQHPVMKAAEPGTEYPSELFGDDPP